MYNYTVLSRELQQKQFRTNAHLFLNIFYLKTKERTDGEPIGLKDELYVIRELLFLRKMTSFLFPYMSVKVNTQLFKVLLFLVIQFHRYLTRDGTVSGHKLFVIPISVEPIFLPSKNSFHTASNISKPFITIIYHCSSSIFSNESLKKEGKLGHE